MPDLKTKLIVDYEQYMADKGKSKLNIVKLKWIEYTNFVKYMNYSVGCFLYWRFYFKKNI